MTTPTCLIKQTDCGRTAADPICPKCGLDERMRYIGEEAAMLAQLQAKTLYLQRHSLGVIPEDEIVGVNDRAQDEGELKIEGKSFYGSPLSKISGSIWKMADIDTLGGYFKSFWMSFESDGCVLMPAGKGNWQLHDEKLLLRAPWDTTLKEINFYCNLETIMTSFEPEGGLQQHLVRQLLAARSGKLVLPAHGLILYWRPCTDESRFFNSLNRSFEGLGPSVANGIQEIDMQWRALRERFLDLSRKIASKKAGWFGSRYEFTNEDVVRAVRILETDAANCKSNLATKANRTFSDSPELSTALLDHLEKSHQFLTFSLQRASALRSIKLCELAREALGH